MKHQSKVRSLTRSLMGLFVTKKGNITRLNHKDEYYRNYYFHKKLCIGIDLVAEMERITKKEAADLLMRTGLSRYMGNNIGEYIKNEQKARALGQKVKMTRFIILLRRYAKSQGMDISKII
jgi:hypothetical protein